MNYLALDLDGAAAEGGKDDLIASSNLQRNVLALLVQCALADSNDQTRVGGLLSLLGNEDTRSGFLEQNAHEYRCHSLRSRLFLTSWGLIR